MKLHRQFHLIAVGATALACMLAATSAMAGRPMTVDDAAVVGVNQCQLESWVQKNSDSIERWAVPACNFTGNLELALGAANITSAEGAQHAVLMQGKTVFKPLLTNGWGVGLVIGDQFITGAGVAGDLYATVPVSMSFADDRLLVHANLGALRPRASGKPMGTWGLGAEMALVSATTLTAEVFGQRGGDGFYQFGLKHWLVPERVQVDMTYGRRLWRGDAARFVSAGLVLVSDMLR